MLEFYLYVVVLLVLQKFHSNKVLVHLNLVLSNELIKVELPP